MDEQHEHTAAAGWRARVDRTVAEYRTRTRVIAARLSTRDQARHEPTHHHADDYDNDVVQSWMADPRGPAPREHGGGPHPAGDALNRIERGEMSWDDVLSGRTGDRESVALRAFLAERAAEIRAAREARG